MKQRLDTQKLYAVKAALFNRPALALAALTVALIVGLTLIISLWPLVLNQQPDKREAILALIATPSPTVSTPRLERAVTAYDAPAGTALGAIEPGRAYEIVARYGNDWVQIEAQDSGFVWIKSVEADVYWASIPNIEPTATPQVVIVEVPAPVPADAEIAAPATAPIEKRENDLPPPPTSAPLTDAEIAQLKRERMVKVFGGR